MSNSRSTLEKEKRAWERALAKNDTRNPSDPLNLWLRFIKWLEMYYCKSYNEKKLELNLVLEECCDKYKEDLRYKNSKQFVRVWIKNINLKNTQEEQMDMFERARSIGIGEKITLFWQAYAVITENKGEYNRVNEIYNEAREKNAEPRNILEKSHIQFLKRIKRRISENKDNDNRRSKLILAYRSGMQQCIKKKNKNKNKNKNKISVINDIRITKPMGLKRKEGILTIIPFINSGTIIDGGIEHQFEEMRYRFMLENQVDSSSNFHFSSNSDGNDDDNMALTVNVGRILSNLHTDVNTNTNANASEMMSLSTINEGSNESMQLSDKKNVKSLFKFLNESKSTNKTPASVKETSIHDTQDCIPTIQTVTSFTSFFNSNSVQKSQRCNDHSEFGQINLKSNNSDHNGQRSFQSESEFDVYQDTNKFNQIKVQGNGSNSSNHNIQKSFQSGSEFDVYQDTNKFNQIKVQGNGSNGSNHNIQKPFQSELEFDVYQDTNKLSQIKVQRNNSNSSNHNTQRSFKSDTNKFNQIKVQGNNSNSSNHNIRKSFQSELEFDVYQDTNKLNQIKVQRNDSNSGNHNIQKSFKSESEFSVYQDINQLNKIKVQGNNSNSSNHNIQKSFKSESEFSVYQDINQLNQTKVQGNNNNSSNHNIQKAFNSESEFSVYQNINQLNQTKVQGNNSNSSNHNIQKTFNSESEFDVYQDTNQFSLTKIKKNNNKSEIYSNKENKNNTLLSHYLNINDPNVFDNRNLTLPFNIESLLCKLKSNKSTDIELTNSKFLNITRLINKNSDYIWFIAEDLTNDSHNIDCIFVISINPNESIQSKIWEYHISQFILKNKNIIIEPKFQFCFTKSIYIFEYGHKCCWINQILPNTRSLKDILFKSSFINHKLIMYYSFEIMTRLIQLTQIDQGIIQIDTNPQNWIIKAIPSEKLSYPRWTWKNSNHDIWKMRGLMLTDFRNTKPIYYYANNLIQFNIAIQSSLRGVRLCISEMLKLNPNIHHNQLWSTILDHLNSCESTEIFGFKAYLNVLKICQKLIAIELEKTEALSVSANDDDNTLSFLALSILQIFD